ncbi:MAG TPA: PqiC family protein [Chthoniobacterales bacterium]
MKKLSLFAALLVALATISCSSPERYYQLRADGPASTNTSGVAIGVGPVTLPDYVDRPELVFQNSEYRFEIPLGHRWTGSLRDTTTRVVGTNLARRLNTGNFWLYPWPAGSSIRYQIAVDVRRFHAVSEGDAVLEAVWTVADLRSGRIVTRQSGTFTEPLAGDGYDSVVAAESRLLAQLTDSIAAGFPGR